MTREVEKLSLNCLEKRTNVELSPHDSISRSEKLKTGATDFYLPDSSVISS